MEFSELLAQLDKQPGADLEAKLVALVQSWGSTESDELRTQIDVLRVKNDHLERTVDELRGQVAKIVPEPIDNFYTMAQFMLRLASKLGRTYGWKTDYALATLNTPSCHEVKLDDIARWQKDKRVPDWAYTQIEILDFRVRIGRNSPEWRAEEIQFLIDLYLADPHESNASLAAKCSERFDRPITPDSIKGIIYRLGRQGRLPTHRPSSTT
jgi:hypothetical protein